MSSYRALLARPGARAVALACALASLSFSAAPLALVLAVEAASGSFARAGAVVAAFSAGAALLAPLRGRLVDRRGRRLLLPLAVVHCCALAGVALLGAAADGTGGAADATLGGDAAGAGAAGAAPWLTLACAALAGAAAPPLLATARARWLTLAGPALAPAAHALTAALVDGAAVAGPALAGLLAALLSPSLGLLVLLPGPFAAALLLAGGRSRRTLRISTAQGCRDPHSSRRRAGARVGRVGDFGALLLCEAALGLSLGALEVTAPALADAEGHAGLAALPLTALALTGVAAALASARPRRAAGLPAALASARRRPARGARTAPAGARPTADPARRFAAGALVIAASLPLTLVLPPSLAALTVVAAAAGAGFGLLNAGLFALLDRIVAPARAIEAFTWLTTGQGAGVALGTAAAGALAHQRPAAALPLVALPSLLAAAAALVAARSSSPAAPTLAHHEPAAAPTLAHHDHAAARAVAHGGYAAAMRTPEEIFEQVEQVLLDEPGTTRGTGFGSGPGVRVEGKIAAMLVGGRLVVKLPAERCAELTAGGAEPLSMGRRTMREWVTLGPERGDEWLPLAQEALAFVRPSRRG